MPRRLLEKSQYGLPHIFIVEAKSRRRPSSLQQRFTDT
jgi:hypothetical protein